MGYQVIPEDKLEFQKLEDGTYFVCLKHLLHIHQIKWDTPKAREEIEKLGNFIKDGFPEYAIIPAKYGDKVITGVSGFEDLHEGHVKVLYDYDDYIRREYASGFLHPFPPVRGIRFEEGIKWLSYECFSFCDDLEEVFLPDSLERLGRCAFQECSVDIGHLPKGLLSFEGELTKNTSELFLPAKLKSLRNVSASRYKKIHLDPANPYFEVFDNVLYEKATKKAIVLVDENVKEVTIKEGTEIIGEDCFANRKALKKVVFSSSVKTIEKGAFSCCENLEEVHLNEGLLSVGNCAFYNCEALTEIIIPASVTKATYLSFGYCINLTIRCKAPAKPEGFAHDFCERSKEVLWGQ